MKSVLEQIIQKVFVHWINRFIEQIGLKITIHLWVAAPSKTDVKIFSEYCIILICSSSHKAIINLYLTRQVT